MPDESNSVSFNVPSLDMLYDDKILQKTEAIFYSRRKKYIEAFPILDKYPQDMIPIYIIYFAHYLNALDDSSEDSLEYFSTLKNDVVLAREVGKTIPELANYLSEIDIEEEDYPEEYEKYKEANKNLLLNKDPKVVSFMNSIYNSRVKNSVHAYLIGVKTPSFEKIGLDLSSEEEKDLCVYIFYQYLYNYYVLMCRNNPFFKYKFKKAFRNTNSASLDDLINIYLNTFESSLYNYDEFINFIQNRQMAISQIIVFSHTQAKVFESFQRTRNE